ncbi:uncharacterized protein LOC128737688 [Sabethes cyaneus]|uniref:uncharacterized protein LOC128737688 n=1 Tax=Sabethes cyaneus TaxID=53552 RepID=UPI00237E69B5|nr:uncharacterized protein LOC128737688 [Sabethes cyaneus]
MANVTVVFEYEEPEFCRLCLSEPSDDNELTKIGESRICGKVGAIPVIETLLQIKLDPQADSNSSICSTCLESLEEFHRYSIRCRTNNTKLLNKIQERNERQIALAKNAIDHTKVLDEVGEGDPIKVILRTNAEGKTSIRVEIQKGPPQVKTERDLAAANENQQQSADVVKKVKSVPPPPDVMVSGKLTLQRVLPIAQFYFYYATDDSYGFIYGGYRYNNSIPRKKITYWVCEQRKSHNCSTLLATDKNYSYFFINSGHNHDPPALPDKLIIYKPQDVLPEVIQHEQIREQELARRKAKQLEQETPLTQEESEALETEIKQESSDSEDEYTPHELFEISDSDHIEFLADGAIKTEKDADETSQASASSKIQIDADGSLFVIKELA